MQDIQLTKHFKLSEFVKGFDKKQHYDVPSNIIDCLYFLCYFILEPIREYAECPIKITSGFRTFFDNLNTGGANMSMHLSGLAADLVLTDNNPIHLEMVFNYAKDQLRSRFGELILYRDDATNEPLWIHIAMCHYSIQNKPAMTFYGHYGQVEGKRKWITTRKE